MTDTITHTAGHPQTGRPALELATFQTAERARDALMRLFRAGVHHEQIAVASPEGVHIDFPAVEEVRAPGARASGGAAVGGALGATLGGAGTTALAATAGSVAGIALMGPLFAGVLSGAVAGGLVGAMTGRGTASDLADYYDQAVRRGRVLVAVTPASPEQVHAIRAAFVEASVSNREG